MKEKEFPKGKEYDFAVGSDHAGFYLKERIKNFLLERDKSICDAGSCSTYYFLSEK